MILALVLAAAPLTLDEVRTSARQNLQAVQAQLDVSRAQVGQKQARAAILPQVDLSLGARASFNGPRAVFNPFTQTTLQQEQSFFLGDFSFGASVSQLIYDGGRWWTAIAQAGAQEEAARGQLAEQTLASELEAVRRFYEVVRAQMTRKVLEATAARSREQLVRATSLFEAGRVQRRDVLDAEVNVANDEISTLRQRQALMSTRLDLLRWTAQQPHDFVAVEPEVVQGPQRLSVPSHDLVLSNARAHRPLVKALSERVRAAELGVTVANADFLPRIGVDLGYSRSSPLFVPFLDPRFQHALSGGVRVSWNVFNGFATTAAVERARVEVTAQRAQESQALLELEAELTQEEEALRTQLEVAAIAEKTVTLAEQQLKLETERYQAGAGSPIDVRTAQLKYTQAQLTQLQGRIDVEIARAMLERSMGAALENP